MNILMLCGSPHHKGSTDLLAESFSAAATEAGHQVIRVDCAQLDIHPCRGCMHCRREEGDGGCVYQDDMLALWPLLQEAEMMVLVTPLYYFGMSAQLKAVIDRFFSRNSLLREKERQAVLLAACGDEDQWAMDGLVLHFDLLCRYMKWENKGQILAFGCYTRQDMEKSPALAQARALANGL